MISNELIVKIDTIDKLKNFVSKTILFDYEIDVIRGRYTIDGKSILGLFSISLLEPICVRILTEDKEVIRRFNEEMEEFRIEYNG